MRDDAELFERLVNHLDFSTESTRRGFLKATLGATVSLPVLTAWAASSGKSPFVILENADGLLVSDTTRCTGCKRCELACTENNDGRAQPSLARIRISRNYNFGPRGQQAGLGRGMGEFGNFRLVQIRACNVLIPVPCATACPQHAIVVDPKTKARVVDPKQCTGCRMCQRACPWEMMTFDETASQSHQMLPVQRETGMCAGLSHDCAEVRFLARPDTRGSYTADSVAADPGLQVGRLQQLSFDEEISSWLISEGGRARPCGSIFPPGKISTEDTIAQIQGLPWRHRRGIQGSVGRSPGQDQGHSMRPIR